MDLKSEPPSGCRHDVSGGDTVRPGARIRGCALSFGSIREAGFLGIGPLARHWTSRPVNHSQDNAGRESGDGGGLCSGRGNGNVFGG